MVSRKSSITFAGGVDMQPRSLNKYYHQRTKRPCLSWAECVYVFVRARHFILHFSVSAVSANAVFLHASLALVCRLFGWRIWNVCARVLVHVFSFRLRDFRSDFVHIWLLSAIYVIWRKCRANTKWRWNKDNERTEHLVLGRGEVEGGRGKWRGERYFMSRAAENSWHYFLCLEHLNKIANTLKFSNSEERKNGRNENSVILRETTKILSSS